MGLIGLAVPEVMGIGYDTVDEALRGNLAIWLMAAMVLVKVVATAAAVGLGVPGGLIGPSLVIGAMGGGLSGAIAQHFDLFPGASVGFHVMLGMGAMMAGALQAPLAALLAILELTDNPNIIFPGMLAVITATLTSGWLHGRESVFQALLRAMGVDYRNDWIARGLRQIGVAAVMNRSFIQLPTRVERPVGRAGACRQAPLAAAAQGRCAGTADARCRPGAHPAGSARRGRAGPAGHACRPANDSLDRLPGQPPGGPGGNAP